MECNLVEMGSRIAARRRRLGISQNFLAEKVDISRNHLSNIERGREKPSFDVLINLCNILRVTPDYLLMGTMHSHGVPQNLIDSLALCTAEDIALLEDIVHHILCRFWICIYCRNLPETFHYIIEIMLVLIVVSDY